MDLPGGGDARPRGRGKGPDPPGPQAVIERRLLGSAPTTTVTTVTSEIGKQDATERASSVSNRLEGSETSRPTRRVLFGSSGCTGCVRYPSSTAHARIRVDVSEATRPGRLKARDTVEADAPASSATS